MALNDIFTMIKADKYTQDGREELIKAQQAETEDKTYKPGDISERTGKQKQPDGSWKFPKQAGGKNAKKKDASKPASTKPTTAESKESTTEQKTPKPSVQEYMKAKSDIKKMEEAYKKQKEDYDYTQRVKANGMDTSLMFPMNVKPKELSENEEYLKAKDIVSRMEAKDSAPRVLTGDCKIRIRK